MATSSHARQRCLGKSRFLESSGSHSGWQCPLRAQAPCPELVCGLILGLVALGVPSHTSAAAAVTRGNLLQSCPVMCPEPSRSCCGGRMLSAVRKAEWMDKRGSPHVAEQRQESPGHLPCPGKPLRAPSASPQWVFAHPGLSQLHQPHFLPLGPRSHPMTTSIPHHTHPSHTWTEPSAAGCQGSQFLPLTTGWSPMVMNCQMEALAHGHLAAHTPRAAVPSFLPHLTGAYRKLPSPAPAPSCKGKHRCQHQAWGCLGKY